MAGTSNRGTATEDWILATPSPRTLISGFWNDDFSSGPFSDAFIDKPQDGIGKSRNASDSSQEEDGQVAKAPLQVEKSSSDGSLPENIGARIDFCSLKIDTSHVGSPASIRSPITIPPGVSPRELLESPVFISNAIAQPSPTTGKLPFFMRSDATPAMMCSDATPAMTSASFQPILRSKPPSCSTSDRPSYDNQQELSLKSSSTATKDVTDVTFAKPKTSDSVFDSDRRINTDEQESEINQDGYYSSDPIISNDEDGYNWRKYGQRQVKNSEHPRTYYKCTHQNCAVKKKVERSQDGNITEIVYKGSHNHPLPPPNRRPSAPFSHFNDLQADGQEKFRSMFGLDVENSPENVQNGHFQDVHGKVLDTRLSPSLKKAELAVTSFRETQEAVDATPDEDDNNKGTHGSTISLGVDGDEDEPESKRRKMGSVTHAATHPMSNMDAEAIMASRAVREPRVVVQTTSEVDILDDGYRWRKYGQKVVKGNPNPRSYYKCTHPCCSVRKHVERASNDLRSVITTYEGKHNHEVPAARSSGGQPSSGTAAAPQGLHRRPEPPAQGSLAPFRGASAYGSQLAGATGAGFFLGMLPHGVAAVPVPSLGTTAVPIRMAGHPHRSAMQRYPGLVLPVGEVKVNPVAPPNATAYEQLMGRLTQGPHMQ